MLIFNSFMYLFKMIVLIVFTQYYMLHVYFEINFKR